MPLPPYPVLPSPRTWAAGDQARTDRLDADLYNAALLLAHRPLFVGAQTTTGQSIPSGTPTPAQMDTENLDNWQVHQVPNATYPAPIAGWYLAEGTTAIGGTTGNYSAGIQATQNSVTSLLTGNWLCSNGVDVNGPGVSDLVQLNPAASDTVSLTAFQNSGAAQILGTPGAYFTVQWAGMPNSSIAGAYTGPLGVVVSSPQAAALWPPGAGTTITNAGGIAAGATSMTVASNTGMVVGGTLGLDYLNNAPFAPVAETVTITSIAGTTIGISATAYPHVQGAPVAVLISAPWMNQQARDLINFLAYPPMARLTTKGSTQSFPNQVFPAGTAVTLTSPPTLDNFTGWSSGTPTRYTFPVAGEYYIYGQCPFQASVGNVNAGIAISGGTIQWGDSVRTQTSLIAAGTVRKQVRVTAGQYVELYASQSSGAAVTIQNDANKYGTLLVLWRGF